MESFGAYLKGLREKKGKTINDIAHGTKIAVANLDFLENDRFDLLPPRVFVKGFIRSYVQELDLDPEEAIARFEAFLREGELPEYEEEDHPVFHRQPAPSFISSKWFTIALTAAGLVSLGILLLTGASRLFMYGNEAKVIQPTVQTAQPSGFRESKQQDMSIASAMGSSRAQAGKKILEIKALERSWVRVSPDSGPAEELMMAPGDVQAFTAERGFALQIGNAGGIRVKFDGRELPELGKPNQTLSLTLP
jgi:transcriptional regulator with XRE-family HTH domain